MLMASIKDDRGYNQGFRMCKSTEIRMKRRADMIMSEIGQLSDTAVLEIGCGTGEISYWIAEKTSARVLGTDLCAPFIENAQKSFVLPNLHYAVLDFNKAEEWKGEKFDFIVGNGILHHLYKNLDVTLSNMCLLLNENGKIIFLEPNLYNPYVYLIFSYPWLRKVANLEPNEMAFSKKYISDKLWKAGYTDIHIDYKDFLLPGIPDFFIQPSIVVGDVLERTPVLRNMAQSIFLRASRD